MAVIEAASSCAEAVDAVTGVALPEPGEGDWWGWWGAAAVEGSGFEEVVVVVVVVGAGWTNGYDCDEGRFGGEG